ncbi:hypothetical protein E2C01_052437 [Portunus trituberculatus]|uniref:Uncharacterized protein n=1 Tax=Portunus trituberculatus TaxID=210409 RepID=A0A5B7GHJ5_PORTR|nr:hypothetical protein [Portunus trituberculatus]
MHNFITFKPQRYNSENTLITKGHLPWVEKETVLTDGTTILLGQVAATLPRVPHQGAVELGSQSVLVGGWWCLAERQDTCDCPILPRKLQIFRPLQHLCLFGKGSGKYVVIDNFV